MITLEVKKPGYPLRCKVKLFKISEAAFQREFLSAQKKLGKKNVPVTVFLIHRGIAVRLSCFDFASSFDFGNIKASVHQARRTAISIANATRPLVARWQLISHEVHEFPHPVQ